MASIQIKVSGRETAPELLPAAAGRTLGRQPVDPFLPPGYLVRPRRSRSRRARAAEAA